MAEDRKRPRYQDPTVASKLKARRPRPHPPPFQKPLSTQVPNKSHHHPHHQSTSSVHHQQHSFNHFSKSTNVPNQDHFSKHQVHRNQLTTITTSTVSTTTYSKSYQYQQEPKFIKHNKDVLIMQLPTSDSGQAWSWCSERQTRNASQTTTCRPRIAQRDSASSAARKSGKSERATPVAAVAATTPDPLRY